MKNILKKLHAIRCDVEKMEKDGTNLYQHYNYLSETQVTLKMKELLDNHGVVFFHNSWVTDKREMGKMLLTEVLVKYAFYDIDTGEKIKGEAMGQGTDTGDKGIYKAITGAIKYIFMKNFMIPTGDDPEIGRKDEKEPIRYEQTQPAVKTQQTANTTQIKATGDVCKNCGAKMVLNPKTNKMFCSDKCWLKKDNGNVADDVFFNL